MSDLPENWTSTQLGEVCKVVRGITFPASAKEEKLTSKNVCCLRTTNVQKEVNWDDVYFVSKEYVKRDEQFVKIGDVLMSMANSYELVGKVSVVRELPYLSSFGAFLSAVRPLPVIDAQYLFHLLRTAKVQSELRKGSSQTVNIANISVSRLSEIEIPLAPLNEQKRIAEKLDSLLARVDSCQTHLERVPQILKRFRQSVLAAATSGRLTEDWRNGNETNWETHPLGDLCSRVSVGHVGITSKYYTTAEEGIPFLRSQNVRPGRVDLSGLVYITREFHERLKKSQLQAGDLLIVRVGANRGDTCVLPSGFTEINCANIVFARPTKILPAYLGIYFQSPFVQEEMLGKAVGGAQEVVNTKMIEQINVLVPSPEEQAEIVRRVEKLLAYAERLEARYTSASEHVERLTPSLLAKAFRGELVSQEQG